MAACRGRAPLSRLIGDRVPFSPAMIFPFSLRKTWSKPSHAADGPAGRNQWVLFRSSWAPPCVDISTTTTPRPIGRFESERREKKSHLEK